MAYFVTGATGFIGRRLVEQLLDKRQGNIYVLVRAELARAARRPDRALDGRRRRSDRETRSAGARRPAPAAAGRRAGAGCGAARQDRALLPPRRGLRHDGAERAEHGSQRRRHDARGRTGARARRRALPPRLLDRRRRRVQGRCSPRTCSTRARSCPRPTTARSSSPSGSCASSPTCPGGSTGRAIVVGDSRTGEMDKIDGPYYFFKAIQRARQLLPEWVPLVGPDLGNTNVVPVDWVVDALEHIAHEPRPRRPRLPPDRPAPPARRRADQRVRRRPRTRRGSHVSVDKRLTDPLPKWPLALALDLPPLAPAAQTRAARARHPRRGARAHGARAALRHARGRPGARRHRRSSARRRWPTTPGACGTTGSATWSRACRPTARCARRSTAST